MGHCLRDNGASESEPATALPLLFGNELERLVVELDGLFLRPTTARALRSRQEIVDRSIDIAGFPPVVREESGDGVQLARVLLDETSHGGVSRSALGAWQGRVR